MVNLRIKDICAQKGITQKSLSEMIEVSTTSLSRIITGEQKPSLDTLEKVATALNVPISSLFEAERDFIAFVRRNGETFTFETEEALKAYAETLPVSDRTNKKKNARLLLTSNRAQLFDYTKIWIILNTSYFRCH